MRTICVFILAIWLASTAFSEELVVIESTSPDHRVGEILDTEINIVLDENVEITLISEDGMIILLAGPYAGPLSRDEMPGVPGVVDALGRLVGYAETEAGDIGGVRGDATFDDFLAQEADDHRTSPWFLHIAVTGPQCVMAAAEVSEFWREQTDSDEQLEVMRVASGESRSVFWASGDNTVAWPDTLPQLADEMYLMRLSDQLRSTNLLVREIPAAVSDNGVATVAFLAAEGCLSQARVALDQLRRNP